MSFLKQQRHDQQSLHWHRAGVDGAPFRGSPAALTEDEFEALAEKVWDSKFGTFDTTQPDQVVMGRTLQEVMDASMSGLWKILYRDHQWGESEKGEPVMYQYIEWSEPHMELPKKHQAASQGVPVNGQTSTSHSGGTPPPIL